MLYPTVENSKYTNYGACFIFYLETNRSTRGKKKVQQTLEINQDHMNKVAK
jgi:hypothetical protein